MKRASIKPIYLDIGVVWCGDGQHKQISRVLNQEGGDLEAVKKKFSSSKFGSVASMKVNVLPEDLP